ncbi:MAG: hypothetical protein HY917_00940 [Candidatus Diapherotrites archaeon]|nr:hypothetical protein [Candidatus Diapherotrites archaeon]
MEFTEQLIWAATGGYLLVGSASIGYLLMKTGWPKIIQLSPEFRFGWAVIAGISYVAISGGLAFAAWNLHLLSFPLAASAGPITAFISASVILGIKNRIHLPAIKLPKPALRPSAPAAIATQAIEKIHQDPEFVSRKKISTQQLTQIKAALEKINVPENAPAFPQPIRGNEPVRSVPIQEHLLREPAFKTPAQTEPKPIPEPLTPQPRSTEFRAPPLTQQPPTPAAADSRAIKIPPLSALSATPAPAAESATNKPEWKNPVQAFGSFFERFSGKKETITPPVSEKKSGTQEPPTEEHRTQRLKQTLLEQLRSAARLKETSLQPLPRRLARKQQGTLQETAGGETPEEIFENPSEVSGEIFQQLRDMRDKAEELAQHHVNEFRSQKHREPAGDEVQEITDNVIEQLKSEEKETQTPAAPASRHEQRMQERPGTESPASAPQPVISRREQRLQQRTANPPAPVPAKEPAPKPKKTTQSPELEEEETEEPLEEETEEENEEETTEEETEKEPKKTFQEKPAPAKPKKKGSEEEDLEELEKIAGL